MASVGKLIFSCVCRNQLRKPHLQLRLALHTNSTQIQSFEVRKCVTMNVIGLHLSEKAIESGRCLAFTPKSSSSITIAPSIYRVPAIGYDELRRRRDNVFDRILPSVGVVEMNDPIPIRKEKEGPVIEEPSISPPMEKRAARLIVIRRKKMKKHKLKKLRKRMYHVFARIKQRREARKEKVFQDELLAQMSRADQFDAEAWVEQFLHKATTDPETLIPKKPRLVKPTRYVIG